MGTLQPPLEVNFLDCTERLPGDALRVLHFADYDPQELQPDPGGVVRGSDLGLPGMNQLDHEIWSVSGETSISPIPFADGRIEAFQVSSEYYTCIRFICREAGFNLGEGPEAKVHDKTELSELTHIAYSALFKLIGQRKLPPHIVRMWNFIPSILANYDDPAIEALDRERYRQFNAGRRAAWESPLSPRHPNGSHRYPAATGIGVEGGALIIEALLTTGQVYDVQNPRQRNPHDYSEKYGTSPPMFSRATVHMVGGSALLFISGTASIVGEDTLHIDDPAHDAAAQTEETFENLRALIDPNNLAEHLPFTPQVLELSDLQGFRIHIRHERDREAVEAVVRRYLGNTPFCIVLGKICRENLLVEVESNATPLLQK